MAAANTANGNSEVKVKEEFPSQPHINDEEEEEEEEEEPMETEVLGAVGDSAPAADSSDDDTKKWPGWPGNSVFRLIVPVLKVGGIIGRKGELIKKLCEETHARVRILEGAIETNDRIGIFSQKSTREEPWKNDIIRSNLMAPNKHPMSVVADEDHT